jgi:uncharacterized protein YvpB
MSASAQILIIPSGEIYHAALMRLSAEEQATIQDLSGLSFDVSNITIEAPKSESTKRPLDDIYRIDWKSFFNALNNKHTNAATAINSIAVSNVQTFAKLLGDSGYSTPKFIVQLKWKMREKGPINITTGQATGLSYKGHGDRTENLEAIRSENIAFYAAFLKAVSQIAAQSKNEQSR